MQCQLQSIGGQSGPSNYPTSNMGEIQWGKSVSAYQPKNSTLIEEKIVERQIQQYQEMEDRSQ